MNYQVWHVNDNLEDKLLQEFDSEAEAIEYVEKLGDRSILASVKVGA